MSWTYLLLAFVAGLFAASVIFEALYRWRCREADELIQTQRRYIAALELKQEISKRNEHHKGSST